MFRETLWFVEAEGTNNNECCWKKPTLVSQVDVQSFVNPTRTLSFYNNFTRLPQVLPIDDREDS